LHSPTLVATKTMLRQVLSKESARSRQLSRTPSTEELHRGRTPTRASAISINVDLIPATPSSSPLSPSHHPPGRNVSWWDLVVDAACSPVLAAATPMAGSTAPIPPDSAAVYPTTIRYEAVNPGSRSRRRVSPPPRRAAATATVATPGIEVPPRQPLDDGPSDYTPFPRFESYRPAQAPLYRLLSRSLSRSGSRSDTAPFQGLWAAAMSKDAEDAGSLKSVDHDVWLKGTSGRLLSRNQSRIEALRREG